MLPIYLYFVKIDTNEYEEIYSKVRFANQYDSGDNSVFYNDDLGLFFEEGNLRKISGSHSISSLKQEEEGRRRMCNQEELRIDEFVERVKLLNETDKEYRANMNKLLLTKFKQITR